MSIARGLNTLLCRAPTIREAKPSNSIEFENACKAKRLSSVTIDQMQAGYSVSFRVASVADPFRLTKNDGSPRTWQNLNALVQYLHKTASPSHGITLNLLPLQAKAHQ